MSDSPAPSDERRAALLEAAVQVFARYGFRKASMDEVARAASLSRQGLYLHFPSKEALFREVVAYLLERSLTAAKRALSDESLPVPQRLITAFDAMFGDYVETLSGTPHLAELLETSTRLVGPLLCEQEQSFRDAVAALLTRAGLARRWKAAGMSAADLAELLEAVAYGLKHRIRARRDFVSRIANAITLVCAPPAP